MTNKSMISINIDYPGCYSQFVPVTAQWHQEEWHHISPALSTHERIELYSSYKNKAIIPSCLVAIINNMPVGSASLVESDMDSHLHLDPWLASVYVLKDYRCQGIADQLIKKCLNNALVSGVQTLYLFTPDQTSFYKKRDWTVIYSTNYLGEHVDIISYDLIVNAPSIVCEQYIL